MTFFDRIKETSTSTGTGTFTLSGAAVGYKAFTNGTYKYCIVNSTETEWEVGDGTVTSGVLTRTTIEASSNGGSAVNFSAGTKYVFNTVSAAYVNSLVPYTGATASVNLGEFGLTAGQLTLDTTPTGTAVVGTTQWNDTIGSSQTLLKGGNVLLKNGVDLVARVVNKVSPATTLTKAAYKAVRVSGAQGQRLAIAYAQANNDNNSADTIGLVCETIAANQEGFIMTVGQLSEINTTGSLQGETWADGDVLYLSPNTAGNITNVKPNGSNGHIVVIGYVEYAHAVHGSIYVKTMNGWELDELHNCYINAPANNEVLTYESATSLWKNKSIATILGYTPQAAITLTTTGSSGAATFVSNTLNIPTVTLAGLGGASDSLVMHLAGTETATGVKTFSIGLATTTGDNFMNTSSGNLLVGYSATPASNLYKINVNGNARFNNIYVNDGTAYSLTFNAGSTNGQLLLSGSYPSVTLKTSTGDNRVNIFNGGPNAGIQFWYGTQSSIYLDSNADGYYSLGLSVGKLSAPVASAILELSSVSRGLLLPRMTTAQKNAITTPATSLLLYDTDLATFQYYSGSAWTSLGGGISGSGTAGQVTYWSGSSAVTGSNNLFWDNTNGRLGIGTNAPISKLHIVGDDNVVYQQATSTNFTGKLYYAFKAGGTLGQAMALFGEFSSGTVVGYGFGNSLGTNVLQIRDNGNININSTSNSGYRLDINGTGATAGALRVTGGISLIQGGGNTSATNALSVQNSDATNILRVRNDNKVLITQLGFGNDFPEIFCTSTGVFDVNGGSLSFTASQTNYGVASYNFYFRHVYSGRINTSGTSGGILQNLGFSPTSGTGTFNQIALTGAINQTGGANGITRGLYINPTLTSAADFRAIETSAGKIIFGGLPTSSAGLPSGALWNNSGVLNIV